MVVFQPNSNPVSVICYLHIYFNNNGSSWQLLSLFCVSDTILGGRVKVSVSSSVVSNSLQPHGLYLPDSSVYGILQARIRGWVAIPFSRGSSWPRDWTQISCIASRFFTVWATRAQTFLCTRHYSRDFIEINSLNPHVKVSLLFPFYRWTN